MNLAEYAIKKKVVTLMFTVFLIVGGIAAYFDMGRLEDPEFTIKEALVVTPYPGATPEEVAEEVSNPMEEALQDLGQRWKIETLNQPGLSTITFYVDKKYTKDDLPQVWDELRRKIGDAQSKLPPGAGPSIVMDDYGDVFGLFYAITSDGYSYKELWDYVDFVRKELLLVDDVSKIQLWGDWQDRVYVEISKAKLASMGVSLEVVTNALKQRNLVAPAGRVRVGPELIRITPTGEIGNVEDLGELIINDPANNRLIHLKDIAQIHRGYQDPPETIMNHNGRMSIGIGISLRSGGNVVDLGAAIDKRFEELSPLIPVGVEVEKVYFQPEFVTDSINAFVINLIEALAIVIVVLMLFMGIRSGLLIGFILLVTVAGTFVFMEMWGIDLQRISLGALIIALGMLVDNAIVVVDGMLVRIEAGMDKIKAAGEVVKQNMFPLLGATLVAIMAFAAIGMSQDSTGEYCRSLFQVIFISLMLSWLLGLTTAPLLGVMFIKAKKPVASASGAVDDDPYKGAFYAGYKKILELCLKQRTVTMGVMVAMLALSLYGFGYIPVSFFPKSSQPFFMMDYWLPEGADIRTTNEDVEEVADWFREQEKVVNVSAFTGQGPTRFALTFSPEKQYPAYGMLLVRVDEYEDIPEKMKELGDHVGANYPDAMVKFLRINLGPGKPDPVRVRFSGPDPLVLREISDKAEAIMRTDPDLLGVTNDWREKVKLIRPKISEAQLRKLGLTRPEVAQAFQIAFEGAQVGVYREGVRIIPIVVRYDDDDRLNVANLSGVQVYSPVLQKVIPIEQLVSGFETAFVDNAMHKRNRRWTIQSKATPASKDALQIIKEMGPEFQSIELPAGYIMEYAGDYEDSNEAQKYLFAQIPGTLMMMILITIILFNAIRQPLIIWLTVPLSIIGVVVGLLVFNQPFGFMALLGILSLTGMLIKNAIVLIDQIDLNIREEMPRYTAVVEACMSRMRPVLMAALTTVLGMIPLAPDVFFGSMAVAIMVGLTFATVLTLLVVPVLYSLLFKIEASEV